jgi:hypothetical protein
MHKCIAEMINLGFAIDKKEPLKSGSNGFELS